MIKVRNPTKHFLSLSLHPDELTLGKANPGLSSMEDITGSSSRSGYQNPPRRVTATKYGSPIYSENKPLVFKTHKRVPRAYPVRLYPVVLRYSAYPPPNRPQRPFRGCNKIIDFGPASRIGPEIGPEIGPDIRPRIRPEIRPETESEVEPETKPVVLVPRYHRLQYVPRIFTWDWTVREHVTGLEMLRDYLSQGSVADLASNPEAVGMFLYTAKVCKVNIGLLDWPQGYWNPVYAKDRKYHKLVIKRALVKLEKLISEEKNRIEDGFGGTVDGELLTDSDSGSESDSASSFAAAGLERLSSADNPLISVCDGASGDSSDEVGAAEVEVLDKLEWLDFIHVSRAREGLGWWASLVGFAC